MNSHRLRLYRGYSISFNSSNEGKFFWDWILKTCTCIKVQQLFSSSVQFLTVFWFSSCSRAATAKECTKKCDVRAKVMFFWSNLLPFCRCRCRRRRQTWGWGRGGSGGRNTSSPKNAYAGGYRRRCLSSLLFLGDTCSGASDHADGRRKLSGEAATNVKWEEKWNLPSLSHADDHILRPASRFWNGELARMRRLTSF